MPAERVAVVGAGIAGLVAAVDLAARGVETLVVERAGSPGGKMREIRIGDDCVDGGPTVLTMRSVFDEIFSDAGASLEPALELRPVEILARHAWGEGDPLDLFADVDRSAEAIGEFAGRAEAQGYRRFCARARRIHDTLERCFIRARRPSPIGLARAVGLGRIGDLWQIQPFATMWRALGEYFADSRLRQLFGRYATYVGSSPFQAPATLMLIAHVEREGVWRVEGGMHRIAEALAQLAKSLGVKFLYDTEVEEIRFDAGRVAGLALVSGERIRADRIVVNADPAALSQGLLGLEAARAVPGTRRSQRSLSAVTWALVARTSGFPLVRHSVFFSDDYQAEFEDLFGRGRLPRKPTVYVCAQDRGAGGRETRDGPERLLCLVNAPATGDLHSFEASEIESCEERAFGLLARCGLRVHRDPQASVVTTPVGFERLFPGTGGALYGPVSHGWRASFRRPGSRSAIPRLYLAGGATHPGAGVPMAAISGRLAAAAVLEDLASTGKS